MQMYNYHRHHNYLTIYTYLSKGSLRHPGLEVRTPWALGLTSLAQAYT